MLAWATAALDAFEAVGRIMLEMSSVVLMPVFTAVLIPVLVIPAPIAIEDLTIMAVIVGTVIVSIGCDLNKRTGMAGCSYNWHACNE